MLDKYGKTIYPKGNWVESNNLWDNWDHDTSGNVELGLTAVGLLLAATGVGAPLGLVLVGIGTAVGVADAIKYYQEKNQRDAATMSKKEKTELEGKIIALREEYTAKAQPLQQEIQKRFQEEQNKLLGLIKQGIDAVASKGKYDVILNSNSVAFINPDNDISQLVLEQVGKIN